MKKYLFLFALALPACSSPFSPMIARWSGEADLARAENSKKVQVEDAKGKLEAAKLLAQAEIERSRGVAEANKIVGESLKNNEAYLRWLWISNIERAEHNGAQIIYIPTEANLPILEASRKHQRNGDIVQ